MFATGVHSAGPSVPAVTVFWSDDEVADLPISLAAKTPQIVHLSAPL